MFSRVIFLVSGMVLAFFYGLATVQFEIFPYEIIRQAKNGLEAFRMLEDDQHQVAIKTWHQETNADPEIKKHSEKAGPELLLVTGGFYQYMDKCPNHGCLAWIMNRDGEVLHTWEVDPASLLGDVDGFAGDLVPMNVYPIGMKLGQDGNLTVSFHGRNIFPYAIGIAQVAPDSTVRWKTFDFAHHWIDVDAEGNVYAPSQRHVTSGGNWPGTYIPAVCHSDKILDEGIRIYRPGGDLDREFWINDSYVKSDWQGLLYSARDECDPAHINSVEVVTEEVAAQLAKVDAGDLLISIREPSAVAILDGQDGAIKHLVAGRTAAQHGPQFLPDGSVVVFDNRGGNPDLGGTRIVRLNMETGDSEVVFPKTASGPAMPFSSHDGGHVDVSPDGKRVMVSSKQQSRVFEFDIESGEVLWEMMHCTGMAPYLKKLDLEAPGQRACFRTYGTYYVEDVPFLR